jgi:hypothetical protein
MKKRQFIVEMEIPEGATVGDIKEYIEDAVGAWCGQFRPPGGYGPDDPGDPRFMIDRDSIKVKRHYPKK